jgi:hypothetical protein
MHASLELSDNRLQQRIRGAECLTMTREIGTTPRDDDADADVRSRVQWHGGPIARQFSMSIPHSGRSGDWSNCWLVHVTRKLRPWRYASLSKSEDLSRVPRDHGHDTRTPPETKLAVANDNRTVVDANEANGTRSTSSDPLRGPLHLVIRTRQSSGCCPFQGTR